MKKTGSERYWDGPALVVLCRCPEMPDRIRERFGRILETKFEHSIHTASRDTILSVSIHWVVLPLRATAESMFRKIEQFIAFAEASPINPG